MKMDIYPVIIILITIMMMEDVMIALENTDRKPLRVTEKPIIMISEKSVISTITTIMTIIIVDAAKKSIAKKYIETHFSPI